MSALVGTQLSGRYRLDAQVGTGGMSTVYRAFDATLERRVAIKLMHRDIAADSDQLERFRREARAVAQLSHPHIVGVIDAGEEDGRPYIVFEYVEGETLKDRIRRLGRLPVDEAIAYAIEIARALGAAHGRGIVHRDVKPQNVLVDEEGSAKVTDFGIARSMDDSGLTAEGRVLGTTDYVSPEQALGHDVNGQSDIYSLGIVLYEMLTGDVPFHGENQVSVAMKHVREDLPDVSKRRPEVSAGARGDPRPDDRQGPAQALPGRAEPAGRPRGGARARARRAPGRSTGEATAVLRTLPESARRRLPLRMRRPLPIVAVVALLAAAAAARASCCSRRASTAPQRGTGQGTVKPEPGTRVVSVKRTSAHDFDPAGDDEEHDGEAPLAVDKDSGTELDAPRATAAASLGKDGVGIYVDADPGVDARSIAIDTPEPGWEAEIRVADGAQPARGHRRLGAGRRRHRRRASASASGSTASATATTSSGSPASRRAPSA